MSYDSTSDTQVHIRKVQANIGEFTDELHERGWIHDLSKLHPPEKGAFDILTPRLRGLKFGSDEYKASLAELKPALDHHYAHNSHHPEHYPNGVAGMDLLDLVEMFCDWKAASQRTADAGTINLAECVRRFGIEPQLASILENTIARWPGSEPKETT